MQIFLVGGAVRDQLLQLPYYERDWVVVGATPEQLIENGYKPVGKDFPVFLHPKTREEYALARTERKTAPGYKGFVFHTDSSVSLEKDLGRRDLTLNAIAKDHNGQLIDPYKGKEDIEKKQLRHVSDAFAEDPVRILRLARFLASFKHLGFSVAAETTELAQHMVSIGETQHLVPERIWQETFKALREKDPQCYFIFLHTSGALADIFPEVTPQLFNACIENLLQISQKTNDPVERFAAFCYALDSHAISSLCERLGTSKEFSELASLSKQYATALLEAANFNREHKQVDTDSKDLVAAVSYIDTLLKALNATRKPERFEQLLRLVICLLCENEEEPIHGFWQDILKRYQQVNSQKLITSGYTGAALGEQIQKARRERIQDYLVNHSHNQTSSKHLL